MPKIAAANSARVTPIVAQRQRIAVRKAARKARINRPGPRAWTTAGRFRIKTPNSGAKITATIQEVSSAIATTANSENVYSPAEERAKPIGTKPATVTKVPVSIGNTVDV
jgi:hypothetical protein